MNTTHIVHARRSNSSSASVGLLGKARYNIELFLMRIRMEGGAQRARRCIAELQDIVRKFEQSTGKLAVDCSVIEVGFGARPERAFGFTAFFGNVAAIDLDAPVLSLRDLPTVFRRNGIERGIKSFARHVLFDAREWRAFHREMRSQCQNYAPDRVRFVLGSAGSEAVWADTRDADLVFSSDVFEHVPQDELRSTMRHIRQKLSPGGLVITRPLIFTGISGGHDLPWYSHRVETQDGSTAWRHLADPDFAVDTYLNRLRRRDYVSIFQETGFSIETDVAVLGKLGEKHLTESRKALLKDYDEYELYSNSVEFILR
jgi:hypothetical protein